MSGLAVEVGKSVGKVTAVEAHYCRDQVSLHKAKENLCQDN